MSLRRAAAVPEQLECGIEPSPLLALLPTAACVQGQALCRGFVPALLLQVMGQLSKSFVVQHCLPSFRDEFAWRG